MKRWLPAAMLWAIALPVAALAALNLAFPFPVERIAERLRLNNSTLVMARDDRPLRAFLGDSDMWMFRVPLGKIDRRVIQATLAVEDQRFHEHPGVDPVSVLRASTGNFSRGRVVSGASTITMQVVRLLTPRPRTFRAKLVEAFRAMQLERMASKEKILELYLNLAPYGGNIVGVEAASRRYFGKAAADVTLDEAALLAGLPQSPTRLRPDRHPRRARQRRNHVLRRMRDEGYLTEAELSSALGRPVRIAPDSPLFDAPHATRMAMARRPDAPFLRTTLDTRVQRLCRVSVRHGVERLRPEVTNGAAVVIENNTGAVRALVGSVDFFSEPNSGQVNGAAARRMPGSALKPFIYALAFDAGLCWPDRILADVPVSFAGYDPRNYDRRFRGLLPASEALSASLNLPAVRLLNELGYERAYGFLRRAGLRTLTRPAKEYGLSFALGSVDVTLLDLTNAYAMLARGGEYLPYRILEEERVAKGVRLIDEGAAWLVSEALADMGRAGGIALWKTEGTQPRMAWKTGTSYGHRDAWTFAYTPEFTVGVWMGNFDARPAASLVGIEAAAPVAARIVDGLHIDRPPVWPGRPASVAERPLCALSGMPPGPHCGNTLLGFAPRSLPPSARCDVHQSVLVDKASGRRLCPLCAVGRDSSQETVEAWPPEVEAWLRQRDPSRKTAPPHWSGCARAGETGASPRIVSPPRGQKCVLTDSKPDRQRLRLLASGGEGDVYWFVNGRLYAQAAADRPVQWPLARGVHRIVCSDALGRSDETMILVE